MELSHVNDHPEDLLCLPTGTPSRQCIRQHTAQLCKKTFNLRRDHLAAVQHHLHRLRQVPLRDG